MFQLAILFIPGLIWNSIVERLTSDPHSKSNTVTLALRAFAFGLLSYFVWFLVYYPYFRMMWGVWPTVLDGLQSAPGMGEFKFLRPKDILFASGIAAVLGVLWSLAANRKLFVRAMQRLRVTRKFGDEGVWEYVFNQANATVEYVHVRDLKNKLVYAGWVKAFSEGGEERELLLEKVCVHGLDDGEAIFEAPLLYLSKKRDELFLEFPIRPSANEKSSSKAMPKVEHNSESREELKPSLNGDGVSDDGKAKANVSQA